MPPCQPETLVPRPRLVAALDSAVGRRVTSLHAPAGYGKSVLLVEWAHADPARPSRPDARVAWLRLDPSDDDVGRFCPALASTLVRVGAMDMNVRAAALGLRPPVTDPALVDFLGPVLDSIARSRRSVIVVLDDAHVLSQPAVLRSLDYLLEYAPSTLHFVLAHRAEPPLRLQRLELAGQLVRIGADELAFDRQETVQLLAAHNTALDDDQKAALHTSTRGWPAGVVLAVHWLARPGNTASQLVPALDSGFVTADYLRSEVLRGLPQPRRRALARIAMVDEINAELAAKLAGDDAADVRLSILSRECLFLTPADATGTWYRWHPLLQALCRRDLAEVDAGAARELHRTAATWFGDHGRLRAAIAHAAQTEDRRFLAELIAERWLELTADDLRTEAPAALAAVPPDVMAGFPELSIAAAAIRIAAGDLPAALPLAEQASSRLERAPAHRRPLVAAMAAGIRLYCAEFGAPSGDAREEVLMALDSPAFDGAPPPAVEAARRFLVLALVTSDEVTGPATSFAELQHLIGDPHTDGLFVDALDAYARLSVLTCYGGALDGAVSQAREVIRQSRGRGLEHGHAVGVALLALAWVEYLRGRNSIAGEYVRGAVAAFEGRNTVDHCRALRLLSLLLIDEQSLDEARMVLHRAYALHATGPGSPRVAAELHATEVDLLRAEGDYLKALRLVGDADPTADPIPYRPVRVVAAEVHLLMENPRAAMQLLLPALSRTDLGLANQISVRALSAAAEVALGRSQAAFANLSSAVRLAAPPQLVRPLLDTYHQLSELLTELADAELPESGFLRGLLTTAEPERIFRRQPARLKQPLTPREQDILRYLRSRLSIVEIAAIVRLSPNTVKTHVKHIYEKLQVTGRQEAVQRAADLNLW